MCEFNQVVWNDFPFEVQMETVGACVAEGVEAINQLRPADAVDAFQYAIQYLAMARLDPKNEDKDKELSKRMMDLAGFCPQRLSLTLEKLVRSYDQYMLQLKEPSFTLPKTS